MKKCPNCSGSGEVPITAPCPECKPKGWAKFNERGISQKTARELLNVLKSGHSDMGLCDGTVECPECAAITKAEKEMKS